MTPSNTTPFIYATRDIVKDGLLEIIEGKIPSDLYGYVYFNSPCGSVNSGGLPYPMELEHTINPEFGTSVFNGDSMVFRFDLNTPNEISFSTGMLKPPCYYADLASKQGTNYHKLGFGFRTLGIARTSFKFGSRNQLNTALTAFKFAGDQHCRLTANFDMGRPWEIDVEKIALKTPIGSAKDWIGEIPQIANYPFPLYQSTAHPAFDPLTKEFFTVNFTKTFLTMFFYEKFSQRMLTHGDHIETKLHAHLKHLDQNPHLHGPTELNNFFKNIDQHIDHRDNKNDIFDNIRNLLKGLLSKIIEFFLWITDIFLGVENAVQLLRWDGTTIDRWTVVDSETGKPIKIDQCMHQNNLTEDYIILSDSAFKFSVDIMMNNPFAHNPELDRKIREITSIAQEPFTPLYIIKRSDLIPGNKTVPSKKVVIDLETVHFSANYANPNNVITLHTAHNAASCASEWIRPYDIMAANGEPIYKNTIGLMTCGEMDIGRIGKFEIDGVAGKIISDRKLYSTGNASPTKPPDSPHTWAVALHTYKDIISPEKVVNQINHIYWQCYGTDPRFLTKFIEGLYSDYQHRIIPVDEIIALNRSKIPFCLLRQNTQTMEIEDGFNFNFNENLRSIQFIPRKAGNSNNPEMDGYIFCTMIKGSLDLDDDNYTREIWLFDAANLKQGPICKLGSAQMNYAFTIHSTFTEDCVSQKTNYNVNIRSDIEYTMRNFRPQNKQELQKFMADNVYPHFD